MISDAQRLFGVHYYDTQSPQIFQSNLDQLYFFTTYIGKHRVVVEAGDSAYFFDAALQNAWVKRGPCEFESEHCTTVIRGYMHPDASCSLGGTTTLPYVNGCSTKQLFPPLRLGDPTLQYLHIPPFSKEQEHHIHSTVRVVLILKGEGISVVGLADKEFRHKLEPGVVCIFDPMSPHHFETPSDEPLVCLPLHIYSSVGGMEKNHPMFNGTIRI
ncbi:MAG: cupin domain-containing protein [Bacteroidia bacterium]